jgi:hypothetical protein
MALGASLVDQYEDCKVAWRSALVRSVASIDTVWLLMRRYDQAFIELLQASGAADVKVRRIRGRDGTIFWFGIRITRPTAKTWDEICDWWRIRPMLLARMDVAIDWHFLSALSAQQFKDWCAVFLRLNWSNSCRWFMGVTKYFKDTSGKRNARRTMALYTNKEDDAVVRLELRLLNTAAVKANGLDHLITDSRAWRKFSVRKLFEKHVSVKAIAPRFVSKCIRRALARHDSNVRGGDWWRSRLPDRVIGTLEGVASDAPTHDLPMVTVKPSPLMPLVPDHIGLCLRHTP